MGGKTVRPFYFTIKGRKQEHVSFNRIFDLYNRNVKYDKTIVKYVKYQIWKNFVFDHNPNKIIKTTKDWTTQTR